MRSLTVGVSMLTRLPALMIGCRECDEVLKKKADNR